MLRTRLNAVGQLPELLRLGELRQRPQVLARRSATGTSSPRSPAASTARTLRRSAPRCSKHELQALAQERVSAARVRNVASPRRRSPRGLLEQSRRAAARTRTPGRAPRRPSRIRRMPCACRRSPNGSRDPVGRSPARNRPTSVSSLSASDTHAHVTRAAPSAPPSARAVGFDRRPAGSGE